MRTIARPMSFVIALAALALAPQLASAGSDETNSKSDENIAAAGYLGIHLQSIEGGLAEALGMDENSGVLVRQVEDDSPASRAGLRAGDIVTDFNGESVGDPAALRKLVRSRNAGEDVKVRYLRDGDANEIQVTLAAAERNLGRDIRRAAKGLHHRFDRKAHRVRELRISGERGFLGVTTQPLTGDLGDYFGVAENRGALVAEVVEDSPADELGLQAGDVIVELGNEDIDDPGTLSRTVRSYEEAKTVEVRWIRKGKERHGKVELELRDSGPMGWLEDADFGSLDFGSLDFLGRAHDGIQRHVEILRMDDDTDEALDELREEMDDLRKQLEKLQKQIK